MIPLTDREKFHFKSQLSSDISNINELLEEIQKNQDVTKQNFESIILSLRDMLAKSEAIGFRVNFRDNVTPYTYRYKGQDKNVSDVNDLVTFIRDAIAHKDSNNNKLPTMDTEVVFNVVIGKGPLAKIKGITLEGEFEDDVAIFYGPQRIYLKRHIVRAFNQAKENLKEFIE